MKDFLKNVGNWNNHRPLLRMALDATSGSILELGMGDGSTPFLHDYAEQYKRKLISYDHNDKYTLRYIHLESVHHTILVADWEKTQIEEKQWSVVLIDQWPAERRHIDAINLKDKAELVIIHDSEPQSTGYMMDKVWPHYKYRLNLVHPDHEAHACMLSNSIDITGWKIPKFTLEKAAK
jgi:hypothetical protein